MKHETAVVPAKLTEANGAKHLLQGEFFESIKQPCQECADIPDDDCADCGGTGYIDVDVPVSWTTIKEIYAKAVKHLGRPLLR